MKRALLVLSLASLLAVPTFAAPGASVASLKGKYSFKIGSSHFNYISNSITCRDALLQPHYDTQWFNTDKMEVIDGVAAFDGLGNVSIAATDYGRFDQSGSNATLVGTCNADGSANWTQGSAVYFPPSPVSATGTYVVQSDGTGSMTLSVTGSSDNPTLILRIAGGTKPATTVLLHGFRASDNSVDVMGTAVLE